MEIKLGHFVLNDKLRISLLHLAFMDSAMIKVNCFNILLKIKCTRKFSGHFFMMSYLLKMYLY